MASVAMASMAIGCIDWGKASKRRSMPTWSTSFGSWTRPANSSAATVPGSSPWMSR